jgi:uncharacterized protein (TIGR02271 family)
MPQTVVGLFLDSAQARKVTAELGDLGVPPKRIEVLDAYVSSFEQRIDGAGIPADDAAIYKEGVRRGGALVLAGVTGDLANLAAALMDDHGAADIDELAQTWAVYGQEVQPTALQESTGPEESLPAEYENVTAAPAEPVSSMEEAAVNQDAETPSAQPESDAGVEHQPAVQFSADTEIELPGGLRLQSVVIETPVEKDVPVLSEHLTFERRPADREATEADFQAFEQGVMDLVELAEELIVSKKTRVIEEVVITKKVRQTTETVRENLKQTHLTTTLSSGKS